MAEKKFKGRIQKGEVRNPNGRKPGHETQRGQQWAALVESLKEEHTARFNRILATCDDATFLTYYTKVLEYWRPRLSSTSALVATAEGNSLQLQINGANITPFPENTEEIEEPEYQVLPGDTLALKVNAAE